MRFIYLFLMSSIFLTACAEKKLDPQPNHIQTDVNVEKVDTDNIDFYKISQRSTKNGYLDLDLVKELNQFEPELKKGLELENQDETLKAIEIYKDISKKIPRNSIIKHRIMIKYSELKDWSNTKTYALSLISLLSPQKDAVSVGEKSLLMDAYTLKAVCAKYLSVDQTGIKLADEALSFANKEYSKFSNNSLFAQNYRKNVMLIHNIKGDIYQRDEHYYLAKQSFNEAIKIDPNALGLYLKRGVINNRLKRYQDVVNDMSLIIGKNPDFAFAYMMRASAYDALKEKDKAQQDLLKFKELCTTCIQSLTNKK